MKRLISGAILFALFCSRLHAALPLSWQLSNPPPTRWQLDAVSFGTGHFATNQALGPEPFSPYTITSRNRSAFSSCNG
jgi:hypothetical protein